MMMIEINRGKRFYNIEYKKDKVEIKYDTLTEGFLLIFKYEHHQKLVSCEGFRIIGSTGKEYTYGK